MVKKGGIKEIKEEFNKCVLEMEIEVLNLWNKEIIKEYMKT